MQPNLPIWFQRLPSDVRRQLELAMAAATEARFDTHAQEAMNVVTVLAARLDFNQAVERYLDIMGLGGEEAQVVHTRALVLLGQSGMANDLATRDHRTSGGRLNWRYATPLGAVRFVRRQLRRNAEEDYWMELSAARAEEALVRTHIKHALIFVDILNEYYPPTRSVMFYLDQLAVPSARSRSVYQRALARVATTELPRLAPGIEASASE
ncbi:MAG: hypothetical protein LBG44_08035 [Gemmatimonadota bacterium]|jgi:hypothetical protein|nr:hypothetical protein [Gemmatimonadota bacterium]